MSPGREEREKHARTDTRRWESAPRRPLLVYSIFSPPVLTALASSRKSERVNERRRERELYNFAEIMQKLLCVCLLTGVISGPGMCNWA